jgi:phenylacetate-coenzyme A ligase PaaK-like adenylate-forming protein
VVNVWGTSEASCNASCGTSPGVHLSDDLAIVEPVDVDGRPVPPGVCSDKHGGGLIVHPHVFRSPLSHRREIVEYQVCQTARGATVAVRCTGSVDLPALKAEIEDDLARLGMADPEVLVTIVDEIGRQALSGKLKRFVPRTGGEA